MTAYSIPNNHLPTHTKHKRRKPEKAPERAEIVEFHERTPELYAKVRSNLLAVYGGELDETSPYFSETAPEKWLALPPLKTTRWA